MAFYNGILMRTLLYKEEILIIQNDNPGGKLNALPF
jgi:hypothetical protein